VTSHMQDRKIGNGPDTLMKRSARDGPDALSKVERPGMNDNDNVTGRQACGHGNAAVFNPVDDTYLAEMVATAQTAEQSIASERVVQSGIVQKVRVDTRGRKDA